ncbi:hypothetical protein EWF20_11400 [Sulfolobus sp. S-194]|uniref:hypothetical protein n=1 Tax=Sulfolobus sp. S-194 TaxID=2512240 RepID=UPI001436FB3C|nr:hypothetical protein [Sulfolobus sp. S-194]QIW24676.1 hypothetical protein EWF20_11400 [Sulfolobus sp. S-194]
MNNAIVWASITLALSVLLTYFAGIRYFKTRNAMWLFWFLGFILFVVASICQEFFAFNIGGYLLSAIYVFTVAELVIALSLGSIQQAPKKWIKAYYGYSLVSTILLIISIVTQRFNVVENGLPMNFPSSVMATSSMGTIVATGIILFFAAKALLFKGNKLKMISVILGVVILGFGGTLVGAGFIIALYLSEIIGMSLFLYGII